MLIRKEIVSLLVLLAAIANECQATCPNGWTTRDSYCYLASSGQMAWNEAESFCQTAGGHLVSFADLNERNYVFSTIISGSGDKWWIGMNDLALEGNFVWSDGTQVNATVFNWKLGEPNNDGDEDCVMINDEIQQSTDGNWVDIQCRKTRRYICKKFDAVVPDCDEASGFMKHGQYCYRYIDEQFNWHDANDICQNKWNAELTAVLSENEQGFIYTLVQSGNVNTWIGLSDSATPGTLKWSNGHDDFTDTSYNNWAAGEPSLTYTGSTCVQSSIALSGQWNVAMCGDLKPFICRKGLRAVCPTGWIYAHGKCYEIIMNANFFLTWTEAYNYCKAKNARLLKIKTEEEQTFITSYASALSNEGILQIWLGISDIGHDNTLTWADQETIIFEHWDGTPSPRAGQNDCAQVYMGKGQDNWELMTCYSHQAFVCEVNEGTPLSDIQAVDAIYWICPKGWRLLPPYCYLFANDDKDWPGAETFCNAAAQGGGHLASIHNSAEQSFIAGHLTAHSWIGLNDRDVQGQYRWTDSTPFNFTNWNPGEPNNAEADENCAAIFTIGTWNDEPCHRGNQYICRKNAVHTNTPQPIPTVPSDIDQILCGDGYLHNPSSHKCYKFVDDFSRSWADARTHCQSEGADLASINSPDEQSFVQANIALSAKQVALWIGGLDTWSGPDAPVIDITDGGWRWTDGSPFNYVNWNAGEPNNVDNEDCIEMVVDHGYWNDLKCTSYRGYVCEKEDPDHTTDPPATDCNGVDCCYRHLGVEKGGEVKDNQLTASSQLHPKSGPDRGRLNTYDQYIALLNLGPGLGGWIPVQDQPEPQWIQIDLKEFYEIRGVITQGLNGLSQPVNQNMWTRQIKISYKTHPDQDLWEPIRDSTRNEVIFDANHDQDTQVTNLFPRPVFATGIRIYTVNCRRGCALRFELVGCLPQCVDSLGVGAIGPGNFPSLPAESFSASSSISGFEPENARLDYTETQTSSSRHYDLDSSTMTWDSARQYCFSEGADLCSWEDICSTGTPIITGVVSGDKWAPIRNSYNDWVEIGDDNNPQNAGRVCIKHNENYGAPNWGITTGPCEPWNTDTDPCPHKGHVFCCPGNTKCWKPTSNDKNQWLQVDLEESRKVSGILLQGNSQVPEYVTQYKVQFSDDGSIFTTYLNTASEEQIFPGNTLPNRISEGFFREPLTTRYVRILPQAWSSAIAIRFEAIGCEGADLVTCRDTAEPYPDTFTVDCPAGCDSATEQLYGTGVYSENSYICAASIHDGRFLADHGGTVDIKKVGGRNSYAGSTQHGITSKDYGNADKSFIFQGDHLGCLPGWDGWKDWCYYTPRISVELSWSDARAYCQQQGADLVSIHTQAEQDFVTTLFFFQYAVSDSWIGLNDFDTLNYYQWSDGSEVTFTRWDVNEPNYEHERCIEMFKTGGLWNDRGCDILNNVVCKMDKIPINQDQAAVDGCEAGWIGFEGSCYFIDMTRMVWINSEDYCKGVGGHLVAINNFNENTWLTAKIAEATHSSDNEKFWIGLGAYLDQNSDSLIYTWSTGEPVTFTAWGPGQPDIRHTCSFPFLYEGIEYYNCIEEGLPASILGGPWCSADPVFTNHVVPCDSWTEGQVGCFRIDSVTGLWSQGQPFACGSDAYKICEKPRIGYTNPVIPTTTHPFGNCPHGWYGVSSSSYCYQINEMPPTQRLNWNDANTYCQSQGAQLASIHSPQEEANIVSGVEHTSGSDWFWIGMRQQQTGDFGWSDGSPIMYTNWGPGEPNNFDGREQCGNTYYDGTTSTWNDFNCDAVNNWICKVLRGTTLNPAVTPPQGTLSPQICGYDVDWVAYTPSGGSQYCYHFSSTIKGYYDAGQYCKSLGGDLVSVHSQDEQMFLTGRTSNIDVAKFWIGLVQENYGGYYVWVDGTMLVYTNWFGSEPNDNNGQESCVTLDHGLGLWADSNCGNLYGYICKKLVGATPGPPVPTPTLPGGCPQGWELYGSKCFLPVGWSDTSMRKTWYDAEQYCNDRAGFLASVPNQYYNAFLVSLMYQAHSSVWIGLNTIGNDRVFLWSDNEAVTFTNWEANEPNAQGTEECVEMYSSGRWSDKECDVTRPFICNVWRSTSFSEPSPDDTGCPSGYRRWDTGCYKLYSADQNQLPWIDARDKCRADGKNLGMTTDLVSIWNWYENAYLKSLFWPDVDYDYTWIGLNYNHTPTNGETEFRWSDGSALYYTNWETNQPQEINSPLGCAEMRNYGTWSVVEPQGVGSEDSCDTKRPFVCKHETLVIPTGDPGLGSCDPEWVALGDYCYFVRPGYSSADQISFGDAELVCNKRSGSLVSIHSDIENKAVDQWAGSKNIWIGLKRNAWGGWEWTDSSPLNFVNWYIGEPNNFVETGEQCTEMYNSGDWNDAVCKNLRGYVCKKHKSYSYCAFPSSQRADCGYDGINEYECLERGCCWDSSASASTICFYSRADADCLNKGGQCKDYVHNICELGYEQSLCSGDNDNKCCFTCDPGDQTCNDQVDGWEEQDDRCVNELSGKCQYDSNYCGGSYFSGYCGGPGQRQCCSTKFPPTDKPPLTEPHPTDKTTTKAGDTKGTTTPKIDGQTTKKQTTTFKTTDGQINEPSGGGLSGGAITGIIIAVLVVVAGVVAGVVYFHRKGSMPFLDSIIPSFNKKQYSDVPGSFDNPMVYSKRSDEDEIEGIDESSSNA